MGKRYRNIIPTWKVTKSQWISRKMATKINYHHSRNKWAFAKVSRNWSGIGANRFNDTILCRHIHSVCNAIWCVSVSLCTRTFIFVRLHAKRCFEASIKPSSCAILKLNTFIEFAAALGIECVNLMEFIRSHHTWCITTVN